MFRNADPGTVLLTTGLIIIAGLLVGMVVGFHVFDGSFWAQ